MFLLYNIIITQYYQSGIYNLPGCSSTSLSHALLVTGYGTFNGYDYWLLKNRYYSAVPQL